MCNRAVCSICKKDETIITDLDSGEMVCSKCGVVISDKIQDTRQEWSDFVNSEQCYTTKSAAWHEHDLLDPGGGIDLIYLHIDSG